MIRSIVVERQQILISAVWGRSATALRYYLPEELEECRFELSWTGLGLPIRFAGKVDGADMMQ